MTELITVKAGDDYFRFTDKGFEGCGMNKASVFPLGQLAEAKEWCAKLQEAGLAAVLMKLTILEEPYSE